MKLQFRLTIAFFFALAGALLFSQYAIDRLGAQSSPPTVNPRQSTIVTPHLASGAIHGRPNHLTIERLGISVAVDMGYYDEARQAWTSGTTSVYFASVTSEPNNQAGNTFIYGHNRANLFKSLTAAAPGDTAVLTTTNGHTFTYAFVSARDVKPSDTSVLNHSDKPILTLQTCSGLWNQNRRLSTFKLVEAK